MADEEEDDEGEDDEGEEEDGDDESHRVISNSYVFMVIKR